MHNAGFDEVRHDGVYVPLPIGAGEDEESSYLSLKATLLELIHHPKLTLRGVSVTSPHKENVMRLARESGWEIVPSAAGIGAANTLVISRDGENATHVQVLNTDALSAAECS